MKKVLTLFLAILLMSSVFTVSAITPGDSYVYDFWNDAIEAPQGYEVSTTVNALQAGTYNFVSPQDIFYSSSNEFYVVDTGNNRIAVLDSEFKFLREYKEFTAPDGKKEILSKPYGIYVDSNKTMYITDKENKRVIISDNEGNIKKYLTRPDSDIFPENVEFLPTKIVLNGSGQIFVLVEGLYYGAVNFDQNGNFIGFYGSNRVQLSIAQLADLSWRKLFKNQDKKTIERYVPVEFSNITCDENNYIFTCTKAMNTSEKLKKLNAMGINILNKDNFGDLEVVWTTGGMIKDTQFVDIAVDQKGFFNALDFERGRLFQYDSEGNLVFIMGGIGNQNGLFRAPSALECVGEDIIVLDSEKANITVYSPTEYAKRVHKAMQLYNQGKYDEAIGPWQEVLAMNENNYYAHSSLGKAYYDKENYSMAMKHFKLGNDREGYSKAFKEYRIGFIRKYFVLFSILLILALLGFVVILKKKKIKAYLASHNVKFKEKDTSQIKKYQYIGYIIRHPIEGYEELRNKKIGSVRISLLILLLWFFGEILSFQLKGFIFNTNKLEEMNIGVIFLTTVFPFILWVVSNWCFCTLLNGEGKAKNIFIFSAYALVPYIVGIYVTLILSNILTLDEGIFSTWLLMICEIYSVFLMYCAIKVVHQYTGKKTVASILLTILGILIIIFLIALAFSLVQQVFSFVVTVYKEFMYRIY